ncbi:xanthine dehydrogenase family protein molybdopterin-binding subunit [Marichromatium bheemlicum]|uniref:Xanthine dehydrogenase family protein molybdopterin-binding subunit n=1 Tax=Marichromatium bheemlicum TaxID=365339 RepID=A0ABX1I8Q2_9GAMM|nr:molybdopterin cofactor-binding domain-containing protein [Marichromatium bheemlicum]NKN33608.1 xanthine dehydrogenase family protein molybdopterin-binding subunit [Marichromatium bheemlicum]
MTDRGSGPRLNRRALLKLGLLAGGGLVLGIDAADATEGPDAAVATGFAPGAWLRLHTDGRIVLMLARSEMGQGVTSTLPMLVAEELEVGLDQLDLEPAPVASDYVNRLLGEQATGCSTSVREAWAPLREAGAVARTLLVRAAAARWGVAAEDCRARRGAVHHPDGETRLDYAALAEAAARLPLPERVTLKPPAQWQLIGTPQHRLDTPDKVVGAARYGLDVRLPGMLYASVARCPLRGARVSAWRADAARALPGVVAVLAVRHGIAVVARDTWSLLRGRAALEVDCDPVADPAADQARMEARLRSRLDARGAALAESRGDALGELARAEQVLEADYSLPFLAHVCMEPMNCTAEVSAERCVIHVPTQAQQRALATARRITGLAPERIEVRTTLLGGGFGRRVEQDFVADAVELAQRLGQPVQVVWTRADDFAHDHYRPLTCHRLRATLGEDGLPRAWYHRIVGPSVLARLAPEAVSDGLDPALVEGATALPYALPARRIEYRRADLPVSVGLWRGGARAHNVYVVESFLDELAATAGRDPLALRLALLEDRPRARAVLERVAALAGWSQPLAPGHGRGIALATGYGSLVAQVVEVAPRAEGGGLRVARVWCVVDCGLAVDPDGVRAQMEGGIAFGLSAALGERISFAAGRVEQRRLADYRLLRFDEMPEVEVELVEAAATPGGVGDLGPLPLAPALAAAIAAAGGERQRALPLRLA